MRKKTIAAICTPLGAGGIAIIRLSGDDAIKIATKFFYAKNHARISEFEPRKLYLGEIRTKNFTEQCMCVYFKAPFSFTGEDIIEFQVHGGIKLATGILQTCLNHGAELAENGEFSKRAFLNGKMTLEQAEGIIDMINAGTDAAIRAGFDLLSGKLRQKVQEIHDILTNLTAKINAAIDYPEHDIEYETAQTVAFQLKKVVSDIENLLSTYEFGRNITDGINCAIIGSTNVGKSSLMNCLLNYDRAIVTEIAGTTRDTLKESFIYKDIKINLIDTAGIRVTEDIVEKMGVERSENVLKSADIILFVVDGSKKLTNDEKKLYKSIKDKKTIVIKNKSDLKQINEIKATNMLEISALNKINIEKLQEMIYNLATNNVLVDNLIITNLRHKQVLEKACTFLKNAVLEAESNQTLDIIALNIMSAYSALGEITGQTTSEEILNEIFSKFCLGK